MLKIKFMNSYKEINGTSFEKGSSCCLVKDFTGFNKLQGTYNYNLCKNYFRTKKTIRNQSHP